MAHAAQANEGAGTVARAAQAKQLLLLYLGLTVWPAKERATTMRPRRSRMSSRSSQRASTAMISDATVMSKPAVRVAGVRRGSPVFGCVTSSGPSPMLTCERARQSKASTKSRSANEAKHQSPIAKLQEKASKEAHGRSRIPQQRGSGWGRGGTTDRVQ